MKIYKLTILLLTSVISTSVFANIPDLFGAYESGAYQAQQDNQRDMQNYYRYSQPSYEIAVYANGSNQPKRNMKVSISRGDNLCWVVYNIPSGANYQSVERFTQPVNAMFYGDTTNNIIGKNRLTGNVIEFYRNISSRDDNQIDSCWAFPKEIATGQYYLSLSVGDREFGTRAFQIVK